MAILFQYLNAITIQILSTGLPGCLVLSYISVFALYTASYTDSRTPGPLIWRYYFSI